MKICIKTLGCKVNAYESECIEEEFKNNGYTVTDDVMDADVIVVNTCTVTNQADAKSRRDLQTQQLQQQIDSGQLTPQQQQKAQRKISRIQQYESQQQQQPNPFIQKPKPASSKSKGRSAALQRVTDDKK